MDEEPVPENRYAFAQKKMVLIQSFRAWSAIRIRTIMMKAFFKAGFGLDSGYSMMGSAAGRATGATWFLLASMLSVACGTMRSRSLGISFPVTLQMP